MKTGVLVTGVLTTVMGVAGEPLVFGAMAVAGLVAASVGVGLAAGALTAQLGDAGARLIERLRAPAPTRTATAR